MCTDFYFEVITIIFVGKFVVMSMDNTQSWIIKNESLNANYRNTRHCYLQIYHNLIRKISRLKGLGNDTPCAVYHTVLYI